MSEVISRSVSDTTEKNNHILKKAIPECQIASHHLISFQLFERLSSERLKQMDHHHYNWNGKSNLVLLPHHGKDSISKMVACHYQLPFHSGAHNGKRKIEKHFKKTVSDDVTLKPVTMTPEEKDMYDDDKKGLMSKKKIRSNGKPFSPINGYHKVVSTLLLLVLKELKCKLTNFVYQEKLETLSEDICEHISLFELLLSNPGFNFAENQVGCTLPDCKKREHTDFSGSWPKDVKVKAELYEGQRLKTLEEL